MQKFENRKERRYPCVNIGAIYSPHADNCINDLAAQFVKAAIQDTSLSGLSFYTDRSMDIGDELLILLETAEEDHPDQLITQVRWCKTLTDGLFSVGVEITNVEIETFDLENLEVEIKGVEHIDIASKGQTANKEHTKDYIGVKDAPMTIDMICPACNQASSFQFVDHQRIIHRVATMPLYNCSNCGSTRSLPGMFTSVSS